MISAKNASEQTRNNSPKLELKNIEKNIKKAIDKGRNECFCIGAIKPHSIKSIEDAGYLVTQQANGIKIGW